MTIWPLAAENFCRIDAVRERTEMELPSLPKTDVAKIVGPYQLLYVIAAVIEGLLGYWFYRADSGVERGFAGVLMALILLGMFYTVIAIKRLEKTGLDSSPDVVTAIHPPLGGDTTAEEIAAPGPEVIAGPDSSFLISSPPDGWDERSVTLSDWVGEALDVKDPATRERMIPSAGQSPDILILERTQRTSIIPNPGRTTVDGRKLPTALEIPCPTQLAIIPLV